MMTPKYNIQLREYAVWAEYEPDGTLSSTGMCPIEGYEKASSCVADVNNTVEYLFSIHAATGEEASSIFNLRLHGDAYIPHGKPVTCHVCNEFQVFPLSSNTCPCCGCFDEEEEEEGV